MNKTFKESQIKSLFLLIILSGLFCLRSLLMPSGIFSESSHPTEENWITESIIGSDKLTLTEKFQRRQDIISHFAEYYLPKKNTKIKIASDFENEISDMVTDYPIEEMVSHIAKLDRQVAGLVIGIAKKESNWGRRSPSKNGSDCFNYWGYKGSAGNGTAMGYACFESAEEAVRIVGSRIEHFVNKKLDTPSKMVVWKCGSSCSWDNPKNVAKWISDVSVYYNQIAYAR